METDNFSLQGPRGNNQDTVFLAASDFGIVALVADGVGGLTGGALASSCVRQSAESAIRRGRYFPEEIVAEAHDLVNSLSVDNAATTATVIFLSNNVLKYAHTGDSRIYIIRGKGLKALTTDQTEASLLVREGVISKEEARTYRRRNVLINAIEKGQGLVLETGEFSLDTGDRIVLLTDGVHKILNKRQMKEISSASKNVSEFSKNIIAEIAEILSDDASMVCIQI